jgi:hypothetical protein
MTIEQTVELPASHRLVLEVPRVIPSGRVRVTFTAEPDTTTGDNSLDRVTGELRELCKGAALTVERFFEMKQEEIALEDAQFRRLFPNAQETE